MGYTCKSYRGTPMVGDSDLDENIKTYSDEIRGYIIDDRTGEVVYDSREKK